MRLSLHHSNRDDLPYKRSGASKVYNLIVGRVPSHIRIASTALPFNQDRDRLRDKSAENLSLNLLLYLFKRTESRRYFVIGHSVRQLSRRRPAPLGILE